MFLGCAPRDFERGGRNQLQVLLRHGLRPSSRVLDVGCGCLRSGYWLMRLLDPGCYFGIEPHAGRLRAGLKHIVEPEVLERARPRFDNNDRFDFRVFDTSFDYVIARSVWTHAAKPHIEAMLDSFVATAKRHGVFLTSVTDRSLGNEDYDGTEWVGRSHQSDEAGIVHHSAEWLTRACAQRNLQWSETGPNMHHQRWMAVTRNSS
jgi:hypothetical protein